MFCQFCGKQINESADVCIGCGKLLKPEKKVKDTSKNYTPVSILILIFASVFCLLGLIALIVGVSEEFIYFSNLSVYTNSLVALIAVLIIEACTAIMSLFLMVVSNKKAINIVSWGISMGLLVLVGLIVSCVGM